MMDMMQGRVAEPIPQLYYGSVVRRLIFGGVVNVLIAILVDMDLSFFYLAVGVVGVVGLTILAALTGRKHWSVVVIDFAVSTILFVVFEYFSAYRFYQKNTVFDIVFLIRQTLAITFLIAIYFSVKTMRAYLDK